MRVINQKQIDTHQGVLNFKFAPGVDFEFILNISNQVNIDDMHFEMVVLPRFSSKSIIAHTKTANGSVLVQIPGMQMMGFNRAAYRLTMSYGSYSYTVLQGEMMSK